MSTTQTTPDFAKELADALRQAANPVAPETREQAIQQLELLGLPGIKHEEYRFTPITKTIEKILAEADPAPVPNLQDIKPYLIPGVETNTIVFVNGQFSESLSSVVSPTNQLTVQSLRRALEEKSPLAIEHFGKLADYKADGYTAYNTAAWNDGVFIHVPAKTSVEKPILIIHLHDANQAPVVNTTRLLMILEPGSEAHIIERFDASGAHPVFHSWVEEIAVKESASLTYCKIQNDPGTLYQVATTMIHQSNSSKVNTYTVTLNGKMIRNNFGITIDGERCESHFHGLYLLNGDTLADNHTVVDHRKPNSFSNELYKGIMDGNSKGIFNGKIYVRPHAQKTNAFQSNRNVLLTDTATIHTKPQLEIWADDVKCSHGCTSGQLDDEALFYLQTRGISRKDAQAMLLYAFASEVLDPMSNQNVKGYIDQLISARLQQGVL